MGKPDYIAQVYPYWGRIGDAHVGLFCCPILIPQFLGLRKIDGGLID